MLIRKELLHNTVVLHDENIYFIYLYNENLITIQDFNGNNVDNEDMARQIIAGAISSICNSDH